MTDTKKEYFEGSPHPAGTLGWFRWYVKDLPDEAELLLPCDILDVEIKRNIGTFVASVALGGRERNADFRIRLCVGDYRVVAPKAERKGRRGGYMNGDLVIEKKSKDSLGNPIWEKVQRVSHLETHIYRLLAGPDALDEVR